MYFWKYQIDLSVNTAPSLKIVGNIYIINTNYFV